ncbi:MAG: hypothetical protein A4E48_00019 [Methanosaeta sp. PtaU1.Bin060]|jgi:hypothetical protein|nr:MAG: hypothetical protein A4E48_00019 [Methanosaeta sp. PtaU1.Bin060]
MFFCPSCNWAGDEWTIQTISKLYTQIEELQGHIKAYQTKCGLKWIDRPATYEECNHF